MPPLVTLLSGPAGSGKTGRLLDRFRSALGNCPPGSTLWLAPTARAAADIQHRLLDGALRACFAPGISTFARFATGLLTGSPRPMRPLSGLMKRQLVRQLLDQRRRDGRLAHFGPIASTAGLLDLLCDFIGQMKRLEIWPEQFDQSCRQGGTGQKDRELLEIYQAYQQQLLDHNLYDAEGRFWSARDLLRQQAEKGDSPDQPIGRCPPERPEGCFAQMGAVPFFPVRYELVVADGFTDFTRTEHDMLQTLAGHAGETWISLPLEAEKGDRPDQPIGRCPPERPEGRFAQIGTVPFFPAGRADLFQKPLRTRDELRRRHPGMREQSVARPENPAWPALAHLETTIFSNPRGMKPAPDTDRLEVIACGRQIGEIETIGRQIKRLLIDGNVGQIANLPTARQIGNRPKARQIGNLPHVAPGEIAVVFRHVEQLADLIGEVFGRLQIPFSIEGARALGRCPPIAMLLRLLELDAEDWPLHKLLAVLGNNYFSPAWTPWDDLTAGRSEIAIRALQVPRGRERFLEHVGWTSESVRVSKPDGAPACGSARHETAGLAGASGFNDGLGGPSYLYRLLHGLARALDELPRLDTLAGHARSWEALADQVGIRRAMRGDADQAAWEQLREALDESARLAKWLGQDAPLLDRAEARAVLVDIAGSQASKSARDEEGRVRVLSAASARHLKAPYLFVAGLNERSFPAADGDDGVYSQSERQRLIEAGLPLPGRGDRQSEEMLLFYEVINAATRRLWLSYPAVDEKGEPLAPSPYLKEVEQACGAMAIVRQEKIDLSPIPAAADVCSPDAFRIRAAAEALDGKPELLAGLSRHDALGGEGLLRGLEFAIARQDRERFGASEGMLSKTAAEAVAAEFPPERIYSATELESYAYCPHRHFLEKLLHVQPMEEIELEVDYAQRGLMAHDLLADFHRRVNEARGGPESPADLPPEEFARILDEAVAETFGEKGDSLHLPERPEGCFAQMGSDPFFRLADALREIDRRKVLQWLAEYQQQHADYDQQSRGCDCPPRPELFEVSFGRPLGEGQTAPSTAEPLEFSRDGETVRLSGRIDRIDLGQAGGQTVFNIIDYKTGSAAKFSLEACQRGHALQLPIYALAAAELMLNDRDATPWQAGYWYLKDGGFKPRQALRMYELAGGRLAPNETWEEVRRHLADTVVALVRAMRRGEFPVWSDDEECTGHCPYKTVCRINQVRSLGKTWRP